MYGAVEGAAFSAVASDGERLCWPMMDFSTDADLLRRCPAGAGAGAAIAMGAATTGGKSAGAVVEPATVEACADYDRDMSGMFGGAVGVI